MLNDFCSLVKLKAVWLLVLGGCFLCWLPVTIYAQDCQEFACASIKDDGERLECVNKKVACLEAKLAEKGEEKKTLSSELKTIDNRIAYHEAQIEKTRLEIVRASKEAEILSSRIENLDKSMQHLAELLTQLVVSSYKTQHLSDLEMFLQSESFTSGMHQKQREEVVSLQTSKLLFKAAQDKQNYDDQKKQREKQQEELEKKTQQLKKQQTDLEQQKEQKALLLKQTQNKEKEFQRLIEEAKKEADSFLRFAATAGGGSCLDSSPGSGENGWFFSQRDPRWCKQYIGGSNMTIGKVGCYISAVTMVHKKYGSSMDPSSFAKNRSHFFANTAFMLTPPSPSGYTYKRQDYFNKDTLDKELREGRPVIVHVSVKNGYGGHFVVIISGEDGHYKMHDPWYGADLDFSSRYSLGMINSMRLFTK